MTYEQFVARMQEHEAELGFKSAEMKEVYRWAAQEQFDYLWRYLTEEGEEQQATLNAEQQAKLDALVKDFVAAAL